MVRMEIGTERHELAFAAFIGGLTKKVFHVF